MWPNFVAYVNFLVVKNKPVKNIIEHLFSKQEKAYTGNLRNSFTWVVARLNGIDIDKKQKPEKQNAISQGNGLWVWKRRTGTKHLLQRSEGMSRMTTGTKVKGRDKNNIARQKERSCCSRT